MPSPPQGEQRVEPTPQQRVALRVIVQQTDRYGEGAAESTIEEEGVMPFVPCRNLVAKGLAERDGWLGPEDGYRYRPTIAGRAALSQHTTTPEEGSK